LFLLISQIGHFTRQSDSYIKSFNFGYRIATIVLNFVSPDNGKMETRIQKTLRHWFPEAFEGTEKSMMCTDYAILRQFAEYTQKLIKDKSEDQKEPFKIIHLLYSKGSLYEKNAIENEFLSVLASDEISLTLKQHLELMPEGLRAIYMKTIVEN